MITRITGPLNRVLDEEVRLQIGGLEYQVLVPEFIRRNLQERVGEEITLHTTQFHEGNPMQGRVVPRLIGFLQEYELEFFELFCTVDKVGVRKALKALTKPVRDLADAIQREDSKWLTTLPGVGAATAEQIVAKLKRKMTRFALQTAAAEGATGQPHTQADGQLFEEAYQALITLGHGPLDARQRLDKVLTGEMKYESVEEILTEIYKSGKSASVEP